MSQESLENFGAYRLVVEDMGNIERDARTYRLIAQQVASADSICANIEEGHGRESTKDYTHFLVMARGSARETRGRYVRMKHWLSAEIVADRVQRCDAILGILAKTISTLKRRSEAGASKSEGRIPSPPAPQTPPLDSPASRPTGPIPSDLC